MMKWGPGLLVCALCAAAPGGADEPVGAPKKHKWVLDHKDDNIAVYVRERDDSGIEDVKAVGLLNAPADVLMRVVERVGDYDEFIPFTAEATVIQKKGMVQLVYQRVDAPFLDERDYYATVTDKSYTRKDGTRVYRSDWSSAPASYWKKNLRKDCIRVTVVDGYWEFEPYKPDPKKAIARYRLFTDPGGAIPDWVLNAGSKRALPLIFEAVEKQAQLPQYQAPKPAAP